MRFLLLAAMLLMLSACHLDKLLFYRNAPEDYPEPPPPKCYVNLTRKLPDGTEEWLGRLEVPCKSSTDSTRTP